MNHLPKEKCNQCEFCGYHDCKCKQTPAPEKVCKCACHENKLGKPYAHDTKCCEAMNGTVEPPAPEKEVGHGYCIDTGIETQPQMLCKCPIHAPEKKWEERLEEMFVVKGEFGDMRFSGWGEMTRDSIKSFIRQLLEEKAVEVEKNEPYVDAGKYIEAVKKVREGGTGSFDAGFDLGYKTANAEAAAILRR